MTYMGQYDIDDTFVGAFNTFDLPARLTALGGSPTVHVYKGTNDTPVMAGVNVEETADSITGWNRYSFTLSSANGFVVNETYFVLIEAGTVENESQAGIQVASFRIRAAALATTTHVTNRTKPSADYATLAYQETIDGKVDVIDGIVDAILALVGTTGVTIANGYLSAAKFADAFLTNAKIADDAINNAKIQAGTISSGKIATDGIGASELSAAAITKIANGMFDQANGVETGVTFRNALKGFVAMLLGKVSGAGGITVTFRNIGDTKDVVVVTTDDDGNRSQVVLDLT
jgi:hypothetical protein